MKFTSKSLIKVLACTVVALGAISMAQAADDVSPAGTWTWTGGGGRGGRGGAGGGANGGARAGRGGMGTNVLVLKYDAGKLTGTLQPPAGGRGRRGGANADGADATTPPPAPKPLDIKDGKWDAATATVSFSVERPARGGGDPTTATYKGKIADDKITGTITAPDRNGDPQDTPWTATKQKS